MTMESSGPKPILSPEAVRLNAAADSKQEAIILAGKLLVDANCVSEEYIDEMLKREEIITTYVGNGVAIPHGTEASRDLINKTGLSFVQLPQGVKFGDDRAYLVIGIAAKDDSHLQILANLAEILCAEETVAKLIAADTYQEISELLSTTAK